MKTTQHDTPKPELDEEDKLFIMRVFSEDIVPKLKKRGARIGTVSCECAGQEYACWLLHFKESGSDFEIVDFEYDENTRCSNL